MTHLYEVIHNSMGLCFWTVPMLIVAAAMVVMAIVHTVRSRKRFAVKEEKADE